MPFWKKNLKKHANYVNKLEENVFLVLQCIAIYINETKICLQHIRMHNLLHTYLFQNNAFVMLVMLYQTIYKYKQLKLLGQNYLKF